MTKSYYNEVLELWKQGLTYQKIGDRFGISRQRVEQILKKKFNIRGKIWIPRYQKEEEIQRLKRFKKYGKADPLTKEEKIIQFQLGRTRARCQQYGIPFDLKIKDFFPLPKLCPVLGIELQYINRSRKQASRDAWASFDRLDPNKGYVQGNVYIISFKANRIKHQGLGTFRPGKASEEDCKKIEKYIADKQI